LTANWMEPGLHYSKAVAKASNDLLMEWTLEYNNLPDVPVHVDINGKIIN